MQNKNKPKVYWSEDKQCYYITFFENTECDEIVCAFNKFKGPEPRTKKEYDQNTNNKKRGRHEVV